MKRFLIIILILITLFIIHKETQIKRPQQAIQDACVFCHKEVSDPDRFHPVEALGCYRCHLGNPYSYDKERAHMFMVRNPGDLRVVEKTCGSQQCHPDMVVRVKRSVMSTNSGMIGTLQEKWFGIKDYSTGVVDLLMEKKSRNLAVDQYRKMCGGCHLWKKRGDLDTERGKRGGGCTDCHIIDEQRDSIKKDSPFRHPEMTTRIPSENCTKCHNRSARIGLSYFGRFESEGYGTPYEGAGFNRRRLSGGRFYLELPADVHFLTAGMDCIDCHPGTELMGDGGIYSTMAKQKEINCNDCHKPKGQWVKADDDLGARLAFFNRKVPDPEGKLIASTRKGTPLYNVQKMDGKWVLFRKRDGAAFEIKETTDNAYHTMKGHERLSCQACHSQWMPQCYGCHIMYREGDKQRDWLTLDMSPGAWKEARSYMRFTRPILGLKDDNTIYPVFPGGVFLSYFDNNGTFRPERSFKVFSTTSFDPHTTGRNSPRCWDCHGSSKVIGLGEGLILPGQEDLKVRPTYNSHTSGMGIRFPLDAIVDENGKILQRFTTKDGRPFNKREIRRILRVSVCTGCHERYDDPIYSDFGKSMDRFRSEVDIPCKSPGSGTFKGDGG